MRKLCRCHEDEKCRRETLTEWMRVVSTEGQEWIRNEMLALGHATLERQKDKIGAAANAKLAEQIGDMEFYGALGDVQTAANFLIGKIFEERIENFLFTATQIGDGVGFQTATLSGKYGIHETGKKLTGHPKTAHGHQRQSAGELLAGPRV